MSRIYDFFGDDLFRQEYPSTMDEQAPPQAEPVIAIGNDQIIITLSNGNTLLGNLSVNLLISFHPQALVSDENIEGLHQYNRGLIVSANTIERDLHRMFVDALQNRERELARIEPQPTPEAQSVTDILEPDDAIVIGDQTPAYLNGTIPTPHGETPIQRFVRTNITEVDNNIGETPAAITTTPDLELAPSE